MLSYSFLMIVLFDEKTFFDLNIRTIKSKSKISDLVFSIVLIAIFSTCTHIPKNAKAVKNFDIDRHLGIWHEITRFYFCFEKDLDNVSEN